VMPAYNAARTLERTYGDLPREVVDHVILVDDVSRDETVEIAQRLGLKVIVHVQNRGYGGNQKTCYIEALRDGADVVVMLHPDYQYDSRLVPQLIAGNTCQTAFSRSWKTGPWDSIFRSATPVSALTAAGCWKPFHSCSTRTILCSTRR
jgi:glycosyltransferase involved in cell wall biosynthesis